MSELTDEQRARALELRNLWGPPRTEVHSQQHLGHPAGGMWCGAYVTNDPGVADVRPRVPVCAVCHIKAMHYRADLLDSTESALAYMTEARDAPRSEVERLTAQVERVRALADKWTYKGEFGWDDGSHAYGPDCEGQALDHAAAELRRVLDGSEPAKDRK